MKINIYSLILASCSTLMATIQANQAKDSYRVFKKWIQIQRVYDDPSFTQQAENIDDRFLSTFRDHYEKNYNLLRPFTAILNTLTQGNISDSGYQLKEPLDHEMKKKIKRLYKAIDEDINQLVEYVKYSGSLPSMAGETHSSIIQRYKAFARLLTSNPCSFIEDELLVGLANRLYEYCFSSLTFLGYQELLVNQKYYPLARFINTVLWNQLVGEGWKHWHRNTLQELKSLTDQGATVWYLAGGNDIYQLLKNGIYSIVVIDPFLPTQANYYAKGWEWLLRGDIDDLIEANFDDKKIVLKRTGFQEKSSFPVRQGQDKIITIPKSITTWTVLDAVKNEPLGSIVFKRRFVKQKDFVLSPQKVFLMSYDEMIYVSMPDILNGWGIDMKSFPDTFTMYIKQLRSPITKDHMNNMRIAALLNTTDLQFINYASDPH